jgi:hypothetical protein
MLKHHITVLAALMLLTPALVISQDRDAKVRNDLAEVKATGLWLYNDLDAGIAEAKQTGKPLLIVFR